MRTAAVFVDAGYFFAETSKAAHGVLLPRGELRCAYASLLKALIGYALDAADGESIRLLRCYWYDGAPRGLATDDQLKVAALPHVKLRLGRLTRGSQKGVDGLIIMDLLTLARERAIDIAFLLSGDEDLREAMLAAQQMGVRVVLLGIPPTDGSANQSIALVREADEHRVIPADFWSRHLQREAVEPAPVRAASQITCVAVAFGFVQRWLMNASSEHVLALRQSAPKIPKHLDAALLGEAEQLMGSLRESEAMRRDLRAAFWDALSECVKEETWPDRPNGR